MLLHILWHDMRRIIFVLLTVLAPAYSFAQGYPLLSSKDVVEGAQESTKLRKPEVDRLSLMRRDRTTRKATAVAIDTNALSSTVVTFQIPDGPFLTIRRSREERHENGTVTWVGKVDSGGSAVLTLDGKGAVGTIDIPRRRFIIQPLNGQLHVLKEVDFSGMPREHPASAPDGAGSLRSSTSEAPKILQSDPFKSATAVLPSSTINVLVAFTPSAIQYLGPMESAAQSAVSLLNESFRNSEVNLNAKLVGTFADPREFSDSITARDGVRESIGLVNARNSLNADIVVMVATFGDNCGIARQILATPQTAYASVAANCFLAFRSFAHEIGHLLGARHDRFNDPTTTPFSYGHGYQLNHYVDAALSWCEHDIMAYPQGCAGDDRINYWSNSRKVHGAYKTATGLKNIYLGDEYSDVARVLNETGPNVTTFRGSKFTATPLTYFSTYFMAAMFVFDQCVSCAE